MMNVIGLWDVNALGIMFLSTYVFVIGVIEVNFLVYFIGSFDGTRDYLVGTCDLFQPKTDLFSTRALI